MYTVFSIYYKYGQFNVDILDDEEDLREYYTEKLEEYDEDTDIVDYEGIENIEVLIEKTIKYGKQTVESQGGWGIVSIIKGDNLIKYGSENLRYFSQC